MSLRKPLRSLVVFAAGLLALSACGGEQAAEKGGEPISIASFNFTDSVIVAETYAAALEEAGYPVERKMELGAREIVYPAMEKGEIEFLPEYIGSALSSGFGIEPPADAGKARKLLAEEFAKQKMTVLPHSEAQNNNELVISKKLADREGIKTYSDLAKLDKVIFAAPPECRPRDTCLRGLKNTYGLDNVQMRSVQEAAPRLEQLRTGNVNMIRLFSTQPILADDSLVALDDNKSMLPPENIVPTVRDDVLESRGQELEDTINAVSEKLTTEELLEMNRRVEIDAENPADVASDWIADKELA